MRHIGRIAFAAVALLATPAASAQSVPADVEGLAADLAYGYCPLYLAGQFPLIGNPKLVELGFTGTKQTAPNPRFGTLEFLSVERADVEMSFGGVPGKVCQINAFGPKVAAIRTRLRADLSMMPYTFESDPANSGKQANGATVETLKAKVDATTVLRVQFVEAIVQGEPMVAFQIFAMEQ